MLGVSRQQLHSELDAFLDVAAFSDYAPNGLQVEGKAQIKRLCTAVSASQMVIDKAIALSADALLVHHGYFWKNEPPCVVGMKKNRLAALLKHDINLFAYHLPLDCNTTLGNNAVLVEPLGVNEVVWHAVGKNPQLLWTGVLAKPARFEQYALKLEAYFNRPVVQVESETKHEIKRIAWCSGGAQDLIEMAADLGADAYISGEVSERTFYQAKELNIHYFGCGHHATESQAIRLLGEKFAKTLGIWHQYIEAENPF